MDTTQLSHKKFLNAQIYITQSKPDKGIPILIQLINSSDISSDLRTFCRIYLAEGYRQKQNLQQGIKLLYEIISDQSINERNRAFAYNRVAALYAASIKYLETRGDSIIKYSNLSLQISELNNYPDLLASSWNELGFLYGITNAHYKLAMEYYNKALKIFINLEMYNNSFYTVFNISDIYLLLNAPLKADSILGMVSTLIEPENNENLFMYLYEKRAKINAQLGNYKEAYNNIDKAYYFEKTFFNDRINEQVAEMSAKYNLQQKEKEIKEANQKSKLKQQQNKILIISIGFIGTGNNNFKL